VRPVVGNNGFGAGYHMIYAPAAYVVTFARLYSYGKNMSEKSYDT
jgi:hypothetical protein